MGKTYNIAVIGGDGTGPEVVREGVKVLSAAASKYGFKINYQDFDFGGEYSGHLFFRDRYQGFDDGIYA